MTFEKFKRAMQKHFVEMTQDAAHLYEISVDMDEFWNLYLDSFPAGTNEIYRQRREYDCSCCRQFIRAIGNAVVIKDNQVHTIWEFKTNDSTFQPVIDALDSYLKERPVTDLHVSKIGSVGTDKNHETMPDGRVHTWEHFHLSLPSRFVDHSGRSIGDIQGEYRDSKNTFKRALDEITEDAIDTVLELISQNSLYRGSEWKATLKEFRELYRKYYALPDSQKDNFAWSQSSTVGSAFSRIRNHSIGTLLVNISNGMDLDTAVRKYESIVAPENYKRPKAIFTKKMLEDAKKTVQELGYMDSLDRRFANLDDITVNNILFSNRDAAKRIRRGDVFDIMSQEAGVNPKKFSKAQEIGAEDFIENVLPTATSVEVLLENRHAQNMVSLIAPVNPGSKGMFKWNNGFSWAYAGNMTDSAMRENVKNAGGNVDGVLRFSIQWNDIKPDGNDLDAHCITPNGTRIYYCEKHDFLTNGMLDVDIINPRDGIPAVENITWESASNMVRGRYQFFVHCFSSRGGKSGFRAEIEFNGVIHSFDYRIAMKSKQFVHVADVIYDPDTGFSIEEKLPSSVSAREMWGLTSNQFIPVSVVCYSPNYWDKQNGIGNKHYFFMLNGCVNPEQPNGFYNEFLKQELVQHKRVFEALGSKMAVADTDDQMSGLGFSSTKRNDLIVRVKGATERILKIKF